MKAMVFAAGLGTRLKPYTLHHPKALVPVAGVPMLQRVIERLKAAGVDEIVVNVHHFANQIADFIKDNRNFGIEIHVSDETSMLLDTGGGILAARPWLEGVEPFIVHNADILTDIPISRMLDVHAHSGAEATLLVAKRYTSRYLLMDTNLQMTGWINTKTGQVRPSDIDPTRFNQYAFGGVHMISPSLFPKLKAYAETLHAPAYNTDCAEEIQPFSIMDFYIATCNTSRIDGFLQPEGYIWHDVGKPDALAAAETTLFNRK